MSRRSQDQDEMAQANAGVVSAEASFHRCLPPMKAHALWAETYDRVPNPLLALEERTLIPFLPNLEGASVLDVACGTGRWLGKLLARGARQGTGIDLSPEMLGQARRKQSLHGCLVCADCAAMPVAAGVADLALCSFAASYVARLEGFAGELSRILKKGGLLILSDFHPACHQRGWRRTFRHAGHVVEILDFQYSIEELSAVFLANGFELEKILSPSFGEAERAIFRECGKEELFESVREGPAIFICCFRLGHSHSLGKRR